MGREKKCQVDECPLWKTGIEVKYVGTKEDEVVYVGESPGKQEEKKGLPFVGDAGELLREVSGEAGLPIVLGGVGLYNSARCKIDKDKLSAETIKTILQCCRPKLELAIKTIKPKLIVALGDIALQQLVRKTGITKRRAEGAIYSEEFGCFVLPTFHPAFILRQMGKKPILLQDLKTAAQMSRNGFKPETVKKSDFQYKDVQSLADMFNDSPTEVGFDTEAQGFDWKSPNFVLMSYSVSHKERVGFQVRLFKECPIDEADFVIEWERLKAGTKSKLERVKIGVKRAENFKQKVKDLYRLLTDESIKKFMMNGNFERHVLRWLFEKYLHFKTPVIARYVMDVQAASNLLDENVFMKPSLGDLQLAFTTRKDQYKEEFAKYKGDMLAAPNDKLTFYACSDADVTRLIALSMIKQFRSNLPLARYLARMTMPALEVCYDMEEEGVGVDLEQFPKTMDEVAKRIEAIQIEAMKYIPAAVKKAHRDKGLKLTRRDLVSDTLFGKTGFGMPPHKRTKEGYSSDKETLKVLMERELIEDDAKAFIPLLQQYTELSTLHSRYLKGLVKHIVDGRIHTSLSMATTVTGRMASSKPNMQNNPKRSQEAKIIRRLFKARPGFIFLSADEGQSELRWCAHVSGDREMIRVFRNHEDPHINTAHDMVKRPWTSLTSEEKKDYRQKAKPVNFGIIYKITARGLVTYAKFEYGVIMEESEAEDYITAFFRKYPGVPRYHEKTIEFCREHEYVDSPLGRRRRLPAINSKDKMLRFEAERMAVNHPIQEPSSSTVILAAWKIRKMELNPEEIRSVLFVHDELIYEVKDNSKVRDYAKIIQDAMIHPPLDLFDVELKVPLESDVKAGYNLADMKVLNIN